jgi:hypothetical protein
MFRMAVECDRGIMQGPQIDGEVGVLLPTVMAFRDRGLMARSERLGTCSLPSLAGGFLRTSLQ